MEKESKIANKNVIEHIFECMQLNANIVAHGFQYSRIQSEFMKGNELVFNKFQIHSKLNS